MASSTGDSLSLSRPGRTAVDRGSSCWKFNFLLVGVFSESCGLDDTGDGLRRYICCAQFFFVCLAPLFRMQKSLGTSDIHLDGSEGSAGSKRARASRLAPCRSTYKLLLLRSIHKPALYCVGRPRALPHILARNVVAFLDTKHVNRKKII